MITAHGKHQFVYILSTPCQVGVTIMIKLSIYHTTRGHSRWSFARNSSMKESMMLGEGKSDVKF